METTRILSELQELKQLTLLGSKDVFTMSDCALYTGLSKSHLYKKVSKKEIPFWKSSGGKITYFDRDEVKAWCLQHRVKTTAEIEQEAADYNVLGRKRKGVAI